MLSSITLFWGQAIMLSINWSQILAVVLLVIGGAGTTALIPVAGYKGYQWWKARKAAKPVVPAKATPATTVTVDKATVVDLAVRGADDPAPDGAVEWIKDIKTAMGGSSAESMLAALLAGESRDKARSRRIAELEKSSKPNAVATVKEVEVKS